MCQPFFQALGKFMNKTDEIPCPQGTYMLMGTRIIKS